MWYQYDMGEIRSLGQSKQNQERQLGNQWCATAAAAISQT